MEHYYDKNNKELNRYIISVPLDGELRYFKRYAKTEKEVKEEFLSFFMSAYKVQVKPEDVNVTEDQSYPTAYNE